ncbi:MAG: Cell division protein ftsZ [uncultured bacterium (gcode 4)]|uniref:Cell division protein FtsZ n=1 Tax=uncultured bacterium (gcode 4) TaxID=1234023 RepID=K2H2W2_9BACT|nr:MAG: Cell division protein ftsZ [uncultured bacterium (gcode 4)]
MTLRKTDDKLKSYLRGDFVKSPIEEINVSDYISPVANIKVVWVGWGWQNAVNRMIWSGLDGVEFIAINTDAQALFQSKAQIRINIWRATTRGLWAGANPEMGKKAAEESSEEIKQALAGADMVFITCWMWGWTGTWASPVIAEIAKWLGALVVWVVTKPFSFEGQRRAFQWLDGFEKLRDKVDTLITIPNDKILSIIDKKTPLLDAFNIVDEVLNQWVQWISDLITHPGLINVDFADVKSIMENAWSALMWIGYGSGESRAVEAARSAIDSPLLELSIAWARGLLFNITWGSDLSMFEVDEAAKIITEACDQEANIIFGATINENYTWEIKITVVATWFNEESNKKFYDTPKPTSNTWFWKRVLGPQTAFTQKPAQQNSFDDGSSDLDVPAFLRNKMR